MFAVTVVFIMELVKNQHLLYSSHISPSCPTSDAGAFTSLSTKLFNTALPLGSIC